jgi:hypothetical protein
MTDQPRTRQARTARTPREDHPMRPQPITAEHVLTICIACQQPITATVAVLPVLGPVVINPDGTATVPVENRITGLKVNHDCEADIAPQDLGTTP